MKWLKNLIGNLKGYGSCRHCKNTWNWAKEQDITYFEDKKSTTGIVGSGQFSLCKDCFKNLELKNVISYYLRDLNRPSEMTINELEKAQKLMIKNIKILKK